MHTHKLEVTVMTATPELECWRSGRDCLTEPSPQCLRDRKNIPALHAKQHGNGATLASGS
jgi:hypothetical protein